MIHVYYTDVNGELRLDMKGHGELKNIEELDVMCAVCTTLANTLALMVNTYEEADMLEDKVVFVGDDGEGKARILAKPKPEYFNIVKTSFETIACGFLPLSYLYPNNVAYIKE